MKQWTPRSLAVVAAVLALAALSSEARAQFFERIVAFAMPFDAFAPDARSRALGGAVVAAPEGPADIWWNPAALPTGRAVRVQYAPLKSFADFDLRTVAVAGEWRNLHLTVAHTGWDTDPMPIRTAYQPEGNGQSVDTGREAWTINVGADLAPWLMPGRDDWNLGLGVSARRLSSWWNLSAGDRWDMSAWDLDAGLLAARRWRGRDSWLRLRAAAVARNAFGADVEVEGAGSSLPRWLRLGVAIEMGLDPAAGRRAPLQVLAAYGREENLDGDSGAEGDSFGLEVTVLELLALRGGTTDRGALGTESYGLGVLIAVPDELPFSARVDYAREDWEDLGGWQDQWAFTLSWDRF